MSSRTGTFCASWNESVALSFTPSPFGEIADGVAARFVSDRTGAGTGRPMPIVPVAGRAPGAAIVHVKRPLPATSELQVQSTAVPLPEPLATGCPNWSTTETVHGSDE